MQIDNVLLYGVVGSTAYGLNNEESDTDYLGLYAVESKKLLGLDLPDLEKAVEFKDPDTKYYEVLHYCRLALKSNPSILELLWLESYVEASPQGLALITLRDAFPTQQFVKAAYLGYANQQYTKLLKDERLAKRAKNARHFIRLLRQGSQLYRTGQLVVALPDPEEVKHLGRKIAHGDLNVAKLEMLKAETAFNANSALSENSNKEVVNEWLLGVRHGLLTN
jgi:uncharacterized protein